VVALLLLCLLRVLLLLCFPIDLISLLCGCGICRSRRHSSGLRGSGSCKSRLHLSQLLLCLLLPQP